MLNKCILIGRLTKDPEIRYSQAAEPLAIASYTLAVNRKVKQANQPEADFVPCVSFGKIAEFAERYLRKGTLIAVAGRIQVRSWIDQSEQKRWTTEVVVEEQSFAESKKQSDEAASTIHVPDPSTPVVNTAPSGFDPFANNDYDVPF